MPLDYTIRYIMHPIEQFMQIDETASVEQALELMWPEMKKDRPNCLVVVGEGAGSEEVITGIVTPASFVLGMASHFLKGAEKIGPIFWEGQLKSEYLLAVKKPIQTKKRISIAVEWRANPSQSASATTQNEARPINPASR